MIGVRRRAGIEADYVVAPKEEVVKRGLDAEEQIEAIVNESELDLAGPVQGQICQPAAARALTHIPLQNNQQSTPA